MNSVPVKRSYIWRRDNIIYVRIIETKNKIKRISKQNRDRNRISILIIISPILPLVIDTEEIRTGTRSIVNETECQDAISHSLVWSVYDSFPLCYCRLLVSRITMERVKDQIDE